MPQVSVIIPTHNRSHLLRTALGSVVCQTFDDFEIVVIDDHSTDDTKSTVAKFADDRIRYLRNKGKNGPSIARNLGISAALGEYIAFLDDDDEWHNAKLEKQIDLVNRCSQQVCGVYTNRLIVDKKTNHTISDDPGAEVLRGNLLYQLLIKNPIHTSTLLVRKICFKKIGCFDESMRYMEDRDLWIRLAMHWEFEYVDEPLVTAYYHGDEHLSHNLDGQTQGREILLSRYERFLKKHRKSWSKMHVCLGAQYCQLGNMKRGRSKLLAGIKIDPFNKMAYFHLLTSALGATGYRHIRNAYKISHDFH